MDRAARTAGCLLTNPTMRTIFGNENLDMAIDPLLMVQSMMATASPDVAIRLTSADLIQFAGFFVAVRQRGSTPGLDDAKRQEQQHERHSNCQSKVNDHFIVETYY